MPDIPLKESVILVIFRLYKLHQLRCFIHRFNFLVKFKRQSIQPHISYTYYQNHKCIDFKMMFFFILATPKTHISSDKLHGFMQIAVVLCQKFVVKFKYVNKQMNISCTQRSCVTRGLTIHDIFSFYFFSVQLTSSPNHSFNAKQAKTVMATK